MGKCICVCGGECNTMAAYELNCLLSTKIPIETSVRLFRGLAQGVIRNGGVVHKVVNMGIRPLGYKIRKSQESHLNAQYVALEMDIAPKTLRELEHTLRVDKHVLRFMTLNKERTVAKVNRDSRESLRKAAVLKNERLQQ